MLYGSAVLIYLAFILGLLLSGLAWGGAILFAVGIFIAILRWSTSIPLLRRGPQTWVWVLIGVVGLMASFYVQFRMPQPSAAEVSNVAAQINPDNPTALYTLEAKIVSLPRLTRSQRQQVWIETKNVSLANNPQKNNSEINPNSAAEGRVYVTLPQENEVSLWPGQTVQLTGRLYRPRSVTNPAGFDFESWLARQNSFSGMKAESIEVVQSPEGFGLWQVKKRILDSQQAWVQGPAGPLIGAMVLGNRAVDLPFETQDAFIQVGLAHALAASGFQISLILACLLGVMRSLPNSVKFSVGAIALLLFLGLSGAEASVTRAVLMGFAGLVSLILGRKMKPIPILIFIAFAMLIYQPLWIWDLGFQLSFLATFGLIVTVPSLQEKLDWMPTTIASLIAVPIAAMVWTLPLQLHSFGVIPVYALAANIVTSPLVSLVTLGGFITGLVGFLIPPLGSALSVLVGIPANGLIWIVSQFSRLPGRTWAVGSISVWQLALVYGAILLVWLLPGFRKRWKLVTGFAILGMIVPIWATQGSLSQLTVFDAGNAPIMVIQQPKSTVLINTGNEQQAQRTVLPFLQHQGINRVDLAIATDLRQPSQAGWQEMQRRINVNTFSPVAIQNPNQLQDKMLTSSRKMRWQPLFPNQTARSEKAIVRVWRNNPALLEFQLNNLTGLMINNANETGLSTWLEDAKLPKIQMIWITSSQWNNDIVNSLQPDVVILSNPGVKEEAIASLEAKNRTVYWTQRDGAIQWEGKRGFSHVLSPSESKSPLL